MRKSYWHVVFGVVILLTGRSGFSEIAGGLSAVPDDIMLENAYLRYMVALDGRNLHFIDTVMGQDCVDVRKAPAFAYVKKAGQAYPASKATFDQGRIEISFGDAGVRAVVGVGTYDHYLTFEVLSVEGEGIEELTFLDVGLSLAGNLEEPFAACALALNLQTNVPEIPGPNARLRAMCYPRFGMEGAKVAVIGCPQAVLRDVMKEVVRGAEELPQSDIGGPFALDAEIGRGSYLFDFGDITEETVDDWVAFVKMLGMNQIDFHTGGSLRFGDCRPNPKLFPNGRASVKAVIDKLHAGGIAAGLHTYAFFMAKDTPYVTPVPDPRLGKDATFTLAEALTAEGDRVPVAESTGKMSTITGFFVRNSVTLQIDDELITYGGIAKEAPFAFTECKRGAYGTKAAVHAAGAQVHHLKECFGLFTPDGDSTLLSEIAENTASTYNECGFDMIYLDALDGEDILGGAENAWHYGSKFAFEIARRLQKPALFEMSTFHHHLWYIRARMGAWDHPSRSHKRFIDVHTAANTAGRGMFLPMNLGWWAVKTWEEGSSIAQVEPTFPDDFEYLMCKCLGNGMGFSLMGVNPGNIGRVPAYQRLAPIFRQYEGLRHAGYFPESIKERLREPGKEFMLEEDGQGGWRFRPVQYAKHKAQVSEGGADRWTVNNPYEEQQVQLRIEALMSAAPYDSPEAKTIEDFTAPEGLSDRAAQEQVVSAIASSTNQVKEGAASGLFSARSDRAASAGAWCKAGRIFEPPLNIAEQRGLGVWIYGDGQGELLNIQLRSPHYTTSGGIGDHYIPVDFTGWRYFELIEMEGARIAEHQWPYGGEYAIYRETVDYGLIETLSFWYNELPPGKEVRCYLSPVRALPLIKMKLVNPSVTIGGKTVTFPTIIESGSYLEFRSMTDCKLYGPKGELLAEVVPQGEAPFASAGTNEATLTCEAPADTCERAYVTVVTCGDPLGK